MTRLPRPFADPNSHPVNGAPVIHGEAASRHQALHRGRTLRGVIFSAAVMISVGMTSGPASGELPSGRILVVQGVVIEGGIECPLLQTEGGRALTLQGFQPHPPPGTRLRLRGTVLSKSFCRQGVSFETIERLE